MSSTNLESWLPRILAAGCGNPFSLSERAALGDGAVQDLQLAVVDGQLAGLLKSGTAPELLEAIVISIGRVQALEECMKARKGRRPAKMDAVLSAVPPKIWAELPGKARGPYVRLVSADARCRLVLIAETIGQSRPMQQLREKIWRACFGNSLAGTLGLEKVLRATNVLLEGESGVGKEVAARAIQAAALGDTTGAAAVAGQFNVAAMEETLAAAELFGSVKGAFTDSVDRVGLVQAASGGTLLLDEVGDMPRSIQAKMLRVMEMGAVTPVGAAGQEAVKVDVRYVAATHRRLSEQVKAGSFRLDLFHRIAGLTIEVPALRERGIDDVREIARRMREDLTTDFGEADNELARVRFDTFFSRPSVAKHGWPGNVRELRSVVRVLLLGDSPVLGPGTGIQDYQRGVPSSDGADAGLAAVLPSLIAERWSEKRLVDWYSAAVRREQGRAKAIALLDISSSTLQRRERLAERKKHDPV